MKESPAMSARAKSFPPTLTAGLFFLCLAFCAVRAAAAVKLPLVFSDNMVLQQRQSLPVWGWAAPGEKVTIEFAGQRRVATTDATGRWEVRLRPLKVSAVAAEFVVAGENLIVLTNVLVGEVWLCSGQSNMEKPIGDQRGQKPVFNAQQELATGNDFPQIRLFKVDKTLAATPEKDVKGIPWKVCSSNALEATKFSAAAYFFAREIYRETKVPVGLVESSWGGTRIEPWTSPVGFNSVPGLDEFTKPLAGTNKLSNATPMAIYNAMIAPLAGLGIRGALWYQGESNCMDVNDGLRYADKMKALIFGWRKAWGQGNFPFYYVQIAPFAYAARLPGRVNGPDELPKIWEAQTLSLKIPKTGMIVTTDLVDSLNDIHPRNKLDVGKRLALLALSKDYGQKNLVSSGPTFKSVKFQNDKAIVSFGNLGGGLVAKTGPALTWFTIAGADGKFVPAEAVVAGDTVVVSSAGVSQPKAVRFAWHETAQPNLFNQAGLPAVPFRTDSPMTVKAD